MFARSVATNTLIKSRQLTIRKSLSFFPPRQFPLVNRLKIGYLKFMGRIRLIKGTGNPQLAQKIADKLKVKPTPVEIKRFANSEIYVRIKEKVRGDDVFVVQSMPAPVNDHLMEVLIIIDSLRRASVEKINLVCPFLAYCRQDRKSVSREPITAKLVANLITTAGVDRVITVDLHTDQIQGFYDIPFDHLIGYPLFADYLKRRYRNQMAIVAPDIGAVKKASKMAILLKKPLVIIHKERPKHNQAQASHIIGEIKGKTAVVLDDIIDTAGTICTATEILKKSGAKKIIVCATHPLLNDEALKRLEKCPAEKIIVLDTVPIAPGKKLKKMKVISLAPLLAKVIKAIHSGRSLGSLFTWESKERIL